MHQRALRVIAGLVAAGSAAALAAGCSSDHDTAGRAALPSGSGPVVPGGPSLSASAGAASPTGGGTSAGAGGGPATGAAGGSGGTGSAGGDGTGPDGSGGSSSAGGTSGGGTGGAAACAAGDLRLAQLPDSSAAGGTVVVAIGLTNITHRACTVRGYPDLTLSGSGGAVPATVQHGGGFPALNAPVTTITVKPAARSGFLLAYLNRPTSASGSCTPATSMALRWGSASVTGPVRISVCGPLRISPYRTGAALGT